MHSGCDGSKQYAAHPTNCARMIACLNGHELECIKGLAFDYATQQCKPTAEVNCTIKVSTVATAKSNQLKDDLKCTTEQRISPHPTDCTKFVICEKTIDGSFIEVETKCPGGLLFNKSLKVCDWPHNVICKPTGAKKPEARKLVTSDISYNPNTEFICLKDGLFPSPFSCSVYYGSL